MAKLAFANGLSFRTLKVWQKCALIAGPFLLPIAALLYLVVTQNNENIVIAQAELRGMEYIRPVKKLVIRMAEHRDLTNRIKNGEKTLENERNRVSTQIDEILSEVDKVDQKLGAEFKTPETKRWEKIKTEWSSIKGSVAALTSSDAFSRHTELISQVIDLATDVWEFSNLALDPVADSYYLQDIIIARVIQGIEDVAQLRGTLAGTLTASKTADKISIDEKVRLSTLLGQLDGTRLAIEKESRRAVEVNQALKGKVESQSDDYKAKVLLFADRVRQVLAGNENGITASDLYGQGSAVIASMNRIFDDYDPSLTTLLEKRVSGYRKITMLAAAGTLLGLIIVAVTGVLVTRSITRQIDNINILFDRIDTGDYKTRAAVLSEDEIGQATKAINRTLDRTLTLIQSSDEKDEIQKSIMKLLDEVSGVGEGDLSRDAQVSADMTGAIADSFNFMLEQLRKIIGNVQTATLQVSSAANEIHTSAEHLADGSENQADQITNTSAAIDEIAVSIQQVSENAATSSSVAQQALQTAKQGNVAVRNTIEGMNRIREQAQETSKRIKRLGETSQEIGQIVQLIDDIADRTSILALNASIQAAAAGDAGRGFAVVAEEVERLAVRSTEATKKIATLVKAIQGETNEAVSAMEKSIQEVVSGSKVANQAGQSLQEIESVSNRLAEIIQSISMAARQQARGSDALAKSMSEISQITRQTAAGTKQTAESVNSLAKLADDLRNSVSTFKLPANSYQEMHINRSFGKNELISRR